MIAVRLDCRLAARVDPSDVVQETLAGAAQRLRWTILPPISSALPSTRYRSSIVARGGPAVAMSLTSTQEPIAHLTRS
jgi:hypothetical protein